MASSAPMLFTNKLLMPGASVGRAWLACEVSALVICFSVIVYHVRRAVCQSEKQQESSATEGQKRFKALSRRLNGNVHPYRFWFTTERPHRPHHSMIDAPGQPIFVCQYLVSTCFCLFACQDMRLRL